MASRRAKSATRRGIVPKAVDTVMASTGASAGKKGRAARITVLLSGGSADQRCRVAEGVAETKGLGMFRLDLSGTVSKYVGETEKGLDAVLHLAESIGSVLFFDEAESLFGKRSEVRDAHDRFANIGVAYLRKRVGAFKGLLILATDRRESIDPAFLRRVDVSVPLPPPRGKKKNQRESSPRPVTRPRARR